MNGEYEWGHGVVTFSNLHHTFYTLVFDEPLPRDKKPVFFDFDYDLLDPQFQRLSLDEKTKKIFFKNNPNALGVYFTTHHSQTFGVTEDILLCDQNGCFFSVGWFEQHHVRDDEGMPQEQYATFEKQRPTAHLWALSLYDFLKEEDQST